MTVEVHGLSKRDVEAIQRVADRSAGEVRRLLPALSSDLVLRIRTGSDVIPETGENATTLPPHVVDWTVDPSREGGVAAIVDAQLRATLFHEFHHLVRDSHVPRQTLMDTVISEGMATAFERDFTGVAAPWGDYTDEVAEWVVELRAQPPDAPTRAWMFEHPDGRRWIGFKVGTYLVDRAMKRSGLSSAEMATLSTEEVVRRASPAREP